METLNLGHQIDIYSKNRSMEDNSLGKDYLKLIWITKEQDAVFLRDMKRQHVQNTLNWCIRKNAGPDERKDGILYSHWIAYFLSRLLDPDLE